MLNRLLRDVHVLSGQSRWDMHCWSSWGASPKHLYESMSVLLYVFGFVGLLRFSSLVIARTNHDIGGYSQYLVAAFVYEPHASPPFVSTVASGTATGAATGAGWVFLPPFFCPS